MSKKLETAKDEYADVEKLIEFDNTNTKSDDTPVLNYCFKVIYKDKSEHIYRDFCSTPQLLGHVFDDYSGKLPEWKNFDELLTLFYDDSKDFGFEKIKIAEIQIFNRGNNEVIHRKNF